MASIKPAFLTFFGVLLISTTIITIFINTQLTIVDENGTVGAIEILNYDGQDLSSINEFKENSIKGPQYLDKETYSLLVTGFVDTPLSYTYDDILSKFTRHERVVTLHCVDGWNVTILWEGILVKDLINEAIGLPNAKIVIFHASDGYSTSLPLSFINKNDIMIAYKMNGVVLPPERGFPFQLVAESKWGYKWIKWITKIELSDDLNYKGFWESRGFSNDGDLSEDFFQVGLP